jgi:sphingomyelin phosphodiesterase
MNYCPLLNFWLFINSTDPLGQLKWLANTLQESESKGEKVHLIGHIHPSGCMESWSLNYYRIVNRYESTIVGQFFGHTHKDQFELFYDLNNYSRPVGMAYITGSVTTFSLVNPGYRIYVVDGNYSQSTWQVLDHENYITNLTEANLIGKPVWKKEYSAKVN